MDDIVLEHNFHIPQCDQGFSALPLMERFRQMKCGGGDVHLYSLLQLSRRKFAAENIDKVYGMLGIMSEATRARIKVDYSPANRRDFWQVYIDISRISLEDHGFLVLFMAPSDQKHPNLPSWCPDFRHDSDVNALYTTFCAGLGEPDVDESRIPKPMISIQGSNNVEFRGLEMDRIKDIVELCPKAISHVGYSPDKAELLLQCEARCLELSKSVFGVDDKIPTQHIGALVTGMHPDRSLYYVTQATEDYHHMRAMCQAVISREDSLISSNKDQKVMISAQRYLGGMTVAWRGSSFFSTDGGRIGIAPKSIKAGDSICIFFGAHVPHVLRFDSAREIYTFVGAAYVAGLMTGDAFYAKDPTNTYKSFVVG